ncbi:hypothetical protein GCM10027176_70650 [Actinoallomurus bryophytorum]|uniref:O-acetyl-ADP-ribose deacetylase (Regulator of RNase III) n=1 Tax=Actinoallomurus bryophytorum TaxID=1490222 RepID=A0A543CUH0_9ACTN|nr:macro domain-containing protein [Actinoallomurus bryophytorum]TQM00753.1 O-acetyl-ADP-ribose deacetylase (regulator of RNase III) [Actinoallomurus bryophytorum]
MNVSLPALGAAAVCLALALATFRWSTRAAAIGYRHTILVFAWLFTALSTTLITFSVFPSSTADGQILGVTLSGAGAFVFLIWTGALRAAEHAADRDARETRQARSDPAPQKPLDGQRTYLYRLTREARSDTARHIGVITGDIRRVQHVDAWVNPENTDMKMARIHERSISGTIRYEGAVHDRTGRVIDDVIADGLARAVRGRLPVAPGTAIVSTAGQLSRRNGVRCLIHTAAVQGEPGAGFRAVRELDRTVVNALRAAQQCSAQWTAIRSVLFPLLGTGHGGAEIRVTTRTLLLAAVDHLATTRAPNPATVLFLAYTQEELDACLSTLNACSRVRKVRRCDSWSTPKQPNNLQNQI